MRRMDSRHRRLIGITIVLFLGVGLADCGSTYVCPNEKCQRKKDFGSLAVACLKFVEHTAPVTTFVAPTDFDAKALEALAALRKVITPEQVPRSSTYQLPEGYFAIQSFRIDETEAVCEGKLGPALQPTAPGYADGCGTSFSIPFSFEGKDWVSHSYKTAVCSSSNQIVPKN